MIRNTVSRTIAIVAVAVTVVASVSASAAFAQSQVTVYGIVDTGVVYTTNANSAGNSVFKMPGISGSVPSRIGFKGNEDLGDGLFAIFTLEAGLSPDTGVSGQGGRLFGRQSYVGLKNEYGSLTFGRLLNMTYLSMQKSDVLGPNIFGLGSIDSYLPSARSDNAVGYLGTFSGVTIGATYSFGRDGSAAGGPSATGCPGELAGNAKACRQVTGLLAYDGAGYGVSASYDILYGGAGAANGLTSSSNSDRRVALSGYWMLGDIKIGGGVLDRSTNAASGVTESDIYFLGATYPFSAALTLDAQIARLNVDKSDGAAMAVARLTYNLSRRTAVYTSVGYMKNSGSSAVVLDGGGTIGTGLNQFGVMTGIRHTF